MTDCGNYETTVSEAEKRDGRFACSCGKVVKIRAKHDSSIVWIPRHNSFQDFKKKFDTRNS